MADPAKILERIRAHGANLYLDGAKLRIVNGNKLPNGAMDHIRRHGRAIAAWLDDEAAYEERAAIMEYDGGLTRPVAEYLARLLLARAPADEDPGTWARFVEQATETVFPSAPGHTAPPLPGKRGGSAARRHPPGLPAPDPRRPDRRRQDARAQEHHRRDAEEGRKRLVHRGPRHPYRPDLSEGAS
jgi:hypothetical protein